MPDLVRKQQAGNLTIAEFCRRHRIRLSKFFYWKKKMKKSKEITIDKSQTDTCSSSTFLPISLPVSRGPGVELVFPSGLKAVIPVTIRPDSLKSIIKACSN